MKTASFRFSINIIPSKKH